MKMLRCTEENTAVRHGLSLFQKLIGNVFLVNICLRKLILPDPDGGKGRNGQLLAAFFFHGSVCPAESPDHLNLFFFHGLVDHTEGC